MSLPQLDTDHPGIVLRELTVRDADSYHELLVTNRAHLTRFGNYVEETCKSLEEIRSYFVNPADSNYRYGIWRGAELVGRVDLNPVAPPRYAIGYWLAEDATGRGYATAACKAIIDYARDELEATDIFAGVTHGNIPSVAVLERLSFKPVANFDDYTRYQRTLIDQSSVAGAGDAGAHSEH